MARATDATTAAQSVGSLLYLFEVAPVARAELAVRGGFSDYEDGVVEASAARAGAEAIVTRSGKDFAGSALAVRTPEEVLASLARG